MYLNMYIYIYTQMYLYGYIITIPRVLACRISTIYRIATRLKRLRTLKDLGEQHF